jgi:Zn-dependent protease with chaperone function
MAFTKVSLAVPLLVVIQSGALVARNVPEASLILQPNQAGDVVLFYAARDMPGRFDLREAAHRVLGCDLVLVTTGKMHTGGTCQQFLKSDRGNLDAWLPLAPLVQELRKAGAEQVDVEVALYFWPGQRLDAGGAWEETRESNQLSYRFRSRSGGELPPPLHLALSYRQTPPRPLIPFLLLLTVPGAIAWVLRRRAARRANHSAPLPAVVWVSWIQLGAWMLWLVALPPGAIVTLLSDVPLHSEYLILAAGAVAFCIPPLLATAIFMVVLRRGADPNSDGFPGFAAASLLLELPLTIWVGFALTGMALFTQYPRAPVVGAVMGLAIGVIVSALVRRGGLKGLTLLEADELQARARQIAQQAGVKLNGLVVFRHRHVRQANAFAHRRSRQILVSDRLLESLTKREVDAVIAHELGHLRGWSGSFPPKLYWAYLPTYFAFWLVLSPTGMFAGLEPYIAIAAVGALLFSAQLSQGRELVADARSAQMNGDPHGMIAGLARLVKLAGHPTSWGKLTGLILSHPSLDRRALALAARFGFPASWALAIVADPDALERGTAAVVSHYAITGSSPYGDVTFSQTAKAVHILRSAWLFPGCLTLQVFAITYAVLGPHGTGGVFPYTGAFLIGLPLVLWTSFRLHFWWSGRFLKKTMQQIALRLPSGTRGDFVGLLPGDAMEPVQGFFYWDLGRLCLDGDRMEYTGERVRFSLPRSAVSSIEIVAGPLAWRRRRGILIRWHDGCFIVQSIKGGSRRDAAKLERQFSAWWKGVGSAAPSGQESAGMAPPDLPAMQRPTPSGLRVLLAAVPQVLLMLLAGCTVSLLFTGDFGLGMLAVPQAAFLYLVAIGPSLISPGRRPSSQGAQ